MQLTSYTDYAFRALIALAAVAPNKLTAGEISERYGISLNHMLKVVQRMAELGYVETVRGKSGGIRLAVDPASLHLGTVVREMEPELGLVACLRENEATCKIVPICRLKGILEDSAEVFLNELDRHTLADLTTPKQRLVKLLELPKHP